jgi:uncharacterized glyoxalase superfamily protein PhnB
MSTLTRVAPELAVHDLALSLHYYVAQLGFHIAMTMPEGDYAIVERDGVAIHLFQSDRDSPSTGSLHIFVDGLDELFEELRKQGVRPIQAIEHKPWGTRDFRVVDPSGNTIKFTESLDANAGRSSI